MMKLHTALRQGQKKMEKSHRTMKLLDMPIKKSLIWNKIKKINTARENVKQTLKTKLNVQLELLYWNIITLNTRAIHKGNVQCTIIAIDRDKKINIEKALRATSK